MTTEKRPAQAILEIKRHNTQLELAEITGSRVTQVCSLFKT